jgi:hypothetical protein
VTALASWALLILGLVYVTTASSIFSPIRIVLSKRSAWLAIFLYCPYCQAPYFAFGLTFLGLGPWHTSWLDRALTAFAAIGVVVVAKAFGGLESPWAQEQGEA